MNTSHINQGKNKFINVAVSSLGDLYGILGGGEGRSYAYKFDWVNAKWDSVSTRIEISDVKTDKVGALYYFDKTGTVYDKNFNKIMDGVKDFEVASDSKIYAISSG